MIPENTAKNPEINTNLEPVINKKVEVEKKGLLEGRSITKETDKHKKNRLERLKLNLLDQTHKQELKKSIIDVKKKMTEMPRKTKSSGVKDLVDIFENKTKEFEDKKIVKDNKNNEIKNVFHEKISKSKKKKISQEAPGRLEGSETSKMMKGRASLRRFDDSDFKMKSMRSKIKGKPLKMYLPQSKETHLILGKSDEKNPSTHSDLKTKQGIEPNIVALKTQAYIVSSISHIEGVSMEKIMPEEKSPVKQFGAMIKTLEEVKDEAKLDNPNDCVLLTNLSFLMNKGSGSGVGQFPTGWKWDELGSEKKFKFTQGGDLSWKEAGFSLEEMKNILKRDDLTEKSLDQKIDKNTKEINEDTNNSKKLEIKVKEMQVIDLENNKVFIKEFKEMLDFLTKNYEKHFSVDERHSSGVELASIQLQATFGQLIHDYVLDPNIKSSALLKSKMIKNGLIDETNFSEIQSLEKNMRNNPLLAEVPNHIIKTDIQKALNEEGETNEKINQFLKNKLLDLAKKKGISDPKLIDGILKEYNIVGKYAEEIGNLKTYAFMSGERGRVAVNAKGAGLELAGVKGEELAFAVMPNRDDDKFATEWNKSHLMDEKTEKFMKATEGETSILKHHGSPTNVLRLGKGLDTRLIEFAEHPELLLQKVLEEADTGHLSGALLTDLAEDLKSEETQQELRDIMGGIEVTFNKSTGQKLPLSEMASMNSVASIMYENDLRTICSISGTTVDAVVGMMLSLGKDGMQKILQPLFNFAEKLVSEPEGKVSLEGEKAQALKELFSGISLFMQTGQYHTAGEVLGGLFIAARALCTDETDNKDIQKTYQMFAGLMKELSSHPELFFAVDEEQDSKIKGSLLQAKSELQERELERIKQK